MSRSLSDPTVGDAHLANLLAAVAHALDDAVRTDIDDVAGLGAAAPAALTALAEFADGASIERLRGVLGLTHSGCVRLVDRLSAAGLATRRVRARTPARWR